MRGLRVPCMAISPRRVTACRTLISSGARNGTPGSFQGRGGSFLGKRRPRIRGKVLHLSSVALGIHRVSVVHDRRRGTPKATPAFQFERSIMHCRHPACFAVHSCHSMPRPRQEAIRPLLQQLPLKGPISCALPLLFPHPLTPRLYFSLTPPHLPSPLTVPLPLPPPSSFPSPSPALPRSPLQPACFRNEQVTGRQPIREGRRREPKGVLASLLFPPFCSLPSLSPLPSHPRTLSLPYSSPHPPSPSPFFTY